MSEWPVRHLPHWKAALRDLTSSGQLSARLDAAAALARAPDELRDEARRALAQALDDAHPSVRAAAALALSELGPESALAQLISMVGREEGRVVQAAVIALGESGDLRVVPALRQALDSPDADVRFQAVLSLARTAPEAALEACQRVLEDEDPEVRANVAAALADLEIASGEVLLERLVTDPVFAVRFEAARALAARGARSVVPVLLEGLADRDVAPQAVLALGQLRAPEAAPALARLCRGWMTPPTLRAAAAAALAGLDDALGWTELDHWLRSRRREPRGMAVYACGLFRLSKAVPLLLQLLETPGGLDREAVAEALGHIGDPGARPALEAARSDPDPDVAAEARLALQRLPDSSPRSM